MRSGEALWYVAPGRAELRPSPLGADDGDSLLVESLWSGVSRGTERLVARGAVPPSEWQRMRCPFQEGDFPFPVKYGYALVGRVVEGPAARLDELVFLLHPHQSLVRVPAAAAHPLPAGLPPRRAPLAANMETALTVVWDAGIGPGDRVLVVGGGVLGLLVAGLAAGIPGAEVTLVDPLPERRPVAEALGARFAPPDTAPAEQDVVIHASATEAGLRLALASAGTEALVVEASWYGARGVTLPLGEAFHSRRLRLRSSQVGAIPPERAVRWSHGRRLAMALSLLGDARYDRLITNEVAFQDAPQRLPSLLSGDPAGLMTLLRYR